MKQALLGVLLAGHAALAAAERYEDPVIGFAIDVPEGWTEMSRAELTEIERGAAQIGFPSEYVAGFRDHSTDVETFSPYVLIQRLKYETWGIRLEPTMDQIRGIVKPMLSGQEAKAVQSQLDRNDFGLDVDQNRAEAEFDATRRRVFYTVNLQLPAGTVYAGSLMQFGRRWATQAIYYAPNQETFLSGGVGRRVVESIALLGDHEWTATIEPEPKRVSSIAVVLVLGSVLGVIGLIAFVALGRRG